MNAPFDTMKDSLGSLEHGASRAVPFARSKVLEGVRVVSGVLGLLRALGVDDALGWVGLSRRRSSLLGSVATFGAGAVIGVGVGMMIAPKSGRELRRSFFAGLAAMEDMTTAAVSDVAAKAEAVAVDAIDAAKKVEQKVETKVAAKIDGVPSRAS